MRYMPKRPTPPQPDLVQDLALEIRAVYRALKMRVRESNGTKEFTAAQLSVLVRLERDGPATSSALARAEGMRPQSMHEVIAGLQGTGFVVGSPDPNDGRKTLLSLSPKCVKWIEEGKAASHDWLAGAVSRALSTREQETLRDALTLLRRVVDEPSDLPPRNPHRLRN